MVKFLRYDAVKKWNVTVHDLGDGRGAVWIYCVDMLPCIRGGVHNIRGAATMREVAIIVRESYNGSERRFHLMQGPGGVYIRALHKITDERLLGGIVTPPVSTTLALVPPPPPPPLNAGGASSSATPASPAAFPPIVVSAVHLRLAKSAPQSPAAAPTNNNVPAQHRSCGCDRSRDAKKRRLI